MAGNFVSTTTDEIKTPDAPPAPGGRPTNQLRAFCALTKAALHLIDCAADVVTLLPNGDLPSAHEALACARAAVGAATYAVRQIHDRIMIDLKAEKTCVTLGNESGLV